MDIDAIIGLSLPAVVIILISTVVSRFRRRRMRRRQEDSATGAVYRSPVFLPVAGWVLAAVGLPIGLVGAASEATDASIPMMVIGTFLLLAGAMLVERAGSVFWLTEKALAYKKPFRSGTIPYVDIRDYHWYTSTSGGQYPLAAHVTITRSNGKKTRFNIAFQHHIDWAPLHQWAQANQRRDLLPDAVAPSEAGPGHQIPRLY